MNANVLRRTAAALLLAAGMAGCAPEVGSERWCKNMAEKPKGDWTANEAGDYAKHCLFKSGDSGDEN
jgi:Protein of unknown function (DUF3012)